MIGRRSGKIFRRSQKRFATFGRRPGEIFRRSQVRFATPGRIAGEDIITSMYAIPNVRAPLGESFQ